MLPGCSLATSDSGENSETAMLRTRPHGPGRVHHPGGDFRGPGARGDGRGSRRGGGQRRRADRPGRAGKPGRRGGPGARGCPGGRVGPPKRRGQ